MYLTIKSLLSVISMFMIGYVCSQILFLNLILGFLLIVALFLVLIGDLLIGYYITPFKPLFEPTPKGKELMEIQLLDGSTHFLNTRKGPQGKRDFWMNGHDASVINDGKAQFRVSGGNIGFRAHELIDRNVDPYRAKALQQMSGDSIKELYYLAKQKIGDKLGRSQ